MPPHSLFFSLFRLSSLLVQSTEIASVYARRWWISRSSEWHDPATDEACRARRLQHPGRLLRGLATPPDQGSLPPSRRPWRFLLSDLHVYAARSWFQGTRAPRRTLLRYIDLYVWLNKKKRRLIPGGASRPATLQGLLAPFSVGAG
jgi:hypothetical protein